MAKNMITGNALDTSLDGAKAEFREIDSARLTLKMGSKIMRTSQRLAEHAIMKKAGALLYTFLSLCPTESQCRQEKLLTKSKRTHRQF